MQTSYNIDEVIENIQKLTKKSVTKKEVREAERYLIQYEKCSECWVLTPAILEKPNLAEEIYIYASSLMKKKLQFDYYQLSPIDIQHIGQLLLKYLENFEGATVIMNLATAFGTLYIHAHDKIGNVLPDLEKTLFVKPNREKASIEVLKYKAFADVAYDKGVVIEKRVKDSYRKFIHENVERRVLEILDQISKTPNMEKKLQYKAYREWIYFSDEEKPEHKELIKNGCFNLALDGMNEPSIAEDSQLVLRRLMKSVKTPEEWPELFEQIFGRLQDYIKNCRSVMEVDAQHGHEYVKVLTIFGKRFAKSIVNNPTQDLVSFVKCLLDFTGAEDIDELEELEDFWNALSEQIREISDQGIKQKVYSDFEGLYVELIRTAIKKAVLSEDHLEFIDAIPDFEAKNEYILIQKFQIIKTAILLQDAYKRFYCCDWAKPGSDHNMLGAKGIPWDRSQFQ